LYSVKVTVDVIDLTNINTNLLHLSLGHKAKIFGQVIGLFYQEDYTRLSAE